MKIGVENRDSHVIEHARKYNLEDRNNETSVHDEGCQKSRPVVREPAMPEEQSF